MKDIDEAILRMNDLLLYRQRSRKTLLPTVIGVGAGRCGTTTLYNYMRSHRDIYMSPIKEINYFGVRSVTEKRSDGIPIENYSLFFSGHQEQKHIGEISPIYLSQPGVAEEIKENIPDCKIVIQVRDPVERFFSQYKHHFSKHGISDFSEYTLSAIAGLANYRSMERIEISWYHPTKNLLQSFYFSNIRKYIELFSAANVMIISYKRLASDPASVTQDLCNFLKIEHQPGELRQSNESSGSIKIDEGIAQLLKQLFQNDLDRTRDLVREDI